MKTFILKIFILIFVITTSNNLHSQSYGTGAVTLPNYNINGVNFNISGDLNVRFVFIDNQPEVKLNWNWVKVNYITYKGVRYDSSNNPFKGNFDYIKSGFNGKVEVTMVAPTVNEIQKETRTVVSGIGSTSFVFTINKNIWEDYSFTERDEIKKKWKEQNHPLGVKLLSIDGIDFINMASSVKSHWSKLQKEKESKNKKANTTNTSSKEKTENKTAEVKKELNERKEKKSKIKYTQQEANQIYNQPIANANASQKILNNWNSSWDNLANQFAQDYETYQKFLIKREQLTRIQANNIQEIQREYRRKLTEIDWAFEDQLAADNRTINQATNSVKTGDYSDVGADIAGELMKKKAKKNAEKQKRQTRAKLQREKDAKIENLKRNIKNKARYERTKYLNAATYALSKQEEDFFLKHYQYHDCAYQNPGAALYNNCGSLPPSNKPYVSSDTPSASEFYEIYLRKKRSSYTELRENADRYLELALQEAPNNTKYLFEKAKAKSTSVEESEVLIRKCLYLEPNNTQYENELKSIIKRKRATLGEEGKLIKGKKQGVWIEYWSDGSEKQKVNYINGKRDGDYMIFYDKDWEETKNKNEVAFFRREQWQNGVKDLEVFDYYKDGQLQMKGRLASENSKELDGKANYFREDGKLSQIINFSNGKYNGIEKSFYPSGELKVIRDWVNGSLMSMKIYSKNGKELNPGNFKDGDGNLIFYNNDEKVQRVVHYQNHKKIQEDYYTNNYSSVYTPEGNLLANVWYYGKIKNPKTYAYYYNKKMIQQFDMAEDGSILNFAVTKGRNNYITTFMRNNGARISVLSKHTNGMPHKIKIEYNVSSNNYLNFNTNLTPRKDGFQIKMKKEYWVLYSNEQGKVTGASVHEKKNGKLKYSGQF